MNHENHIRFEIEGITYYSWPSIEQSIKKTMFRCHPADSIVKCMDFDSGELLDELRLDELFTNN